MTADNNNKSSPAFDQYELEMFNEPTTGREDVDSEDEDNCNDNGDSSKVDQMLSR